MGRLHDDGEEHADHRRDVRLRHRRDDQGRRHLRRGQPVVPRAGVLPRVRGLHADDARWTTILDKSYELLCRGPERDLGPGARLVGGARTNTSYGYDATRTPFRIALDVCWSGDPRAKTFSQKIGAFFAGIGAANIVDGYNVNGTVTGTYKNSTFVGPAGAAGMASNQTQLVADAYTRVAADAKAAEHQLLRSVVGAVHGHADDRQLRQFPVALDGLLLEDRRAA